MKKIFNFLLITLFSVIFFSCEKGDIFSGSPADSNVTFETLNATISSTASELVSGQRFPITINLNRSFPVDVNIEVTTIITNSSKKTRRFIIVPANQMSANGFATAPGGVQASTLPFILTGEIYLSAINTISNEEIPFGFEGKQYSITSNKLSFNYGDTVFADVNPTRFGLVFDYMGPYDAANNDLNLIVKRNGLPITVNSISGGTIGVNGAVSRSIRYETVNFLSNALDAEYIIEAWARFLTTSPSNNLPFRITIRFPDESTKTLAGVLNGLIPSTNVLTANKIPVIKVIKTTVAGIPQYDAILL